MYIDLTLNVTISSLSVHIVLILVGIFLSVIDIFEINYMEYVDRLW